MLLQNVLNYVPSVLFLSASLTSSIFNFPLLGFKLAWTIENWISRLFTHSSGLNYNCAITPHSISGHWSFPDTEIFFPLVLSHISRSFPLVKSSAKLKLYSGTLSLHIFTLTVSLNPGLRLDNSIFGNAISSLDSVGINPVKIIITNFSLFKYKTKVICAIYHFATKLLNSNSTFFYQCEWLKFCQSQWRYLTWTGNGLVHLKDCYLSQQIFSLILGGYCFNMVQDLRIKVSLSTFNYIKDYLEKIKQCLLAAEILSPLASFLLAPSSAPFATIH